MNTSRIQRKITVTEIEKEFILKNHNRLEIREMARQLNIGKGKVYQNFVLLGLSKSRNEKVEVYDADIFDVDLFAKIYKY